jgi:molybdate transport system substrate-binding protein
MFASLLALGGMTWALMNSDVRRTSTSPDASQPGSAASQGDSKIAEISLFCAASNQAVMEEIRRAYEAETGRRVVIQYGSSQSLLSQIEVSGTGDLYLPADDSFLAMGREKKLIAESIEIATMNCGIVVPKGNPKGIDELSDLFATDLRLVQANPDAAAIGKLTKKITTASGLWDQLDKATAAYRTTVTDVANDVLVGAADAGIVYDAVLHTYPDLQFVNVPELAEGVSQVSVGVISSSPQPSAALHFARYVSARDRGLKHYQTHGFKISSGDEWQDEPELTIYAGSMLRPAIEDTIIEFEQREGVRVSRASGRKRESKENWIAAGSDQRRLACRDRS